MNLETSFSFNLVYSLVCLDRAKVVWLGYSKQAQEGRVVSDKKLTRDQHRQAVKEHIAILQKVINYHKERLKRTKYKYRE